MGCVNRFEYVLLTNESLGLFDLQSASIDAFARDFKSSLHILNEDVIEWYWLCSYAGAGNIL